MILPIIKRVNATRRGMMVTITILLLGLSANTIAFKYWSDASDQYMAARITADGYRARQMAVAGFEAATAALNAIPEEYLFSTELALNPPDILLSKDCKPRCMVSYRLQPEDGKLNVNNLIISNSDEPNELYRSIFERFFRNYDIEDPEEKVSAMIDWIDENNTKESYGAESEYYNELSPPIKIKNFRLFSLSEICQIKGIDYSTIYDSQVPEGWFEEQEKLKFLTDDEEALIHEADWIPANNLTALYAGMNQLNHKVNINAARYHALMSLSESMTKEAVLAIYELRRKSGNYIKNIEALKNLPEFEVKNGELTLYNELAGSGGALSGVIKTKGEIYRIIGVGTIVGGADNENVKPIIRKISGLYDLRSRKLFYYNED